MRAPATASGAPGPTPADAAAARALARQKAVATGLVALCALAYAAAKALEQRHPAVAYLAAFAEAAIIGALADWYAVVALFRHPLGLKLPHTAIIPANQTRIAEAIGDFIAKHFLAGPRVGAKVLELDPAASAGRWLAEPDNRGQLAAHAARLVPDAVEAIDRELLRGEIERGVLDRLATVDFGKVIGTSLEVITRNRRHHAILDDVLGRIESQLAEPAALAAIRERIRAELPTLFRFFFADAYLLQRLVRASHALLAEVRWDPVHPLRAEFDRLIAEFIVKLRNSREHREKMEGLKQELLARAELREILLESWDRFVAALRADIERDDGIIRPGFAAFLGDMAGRLQHDADLRARLNRWLADAAAAMTERYKHEAAAFVTAQVKSWDARHAVRTIELSLGKDLQYIRINGTLVGGLLGLAIFAATRLALP
jgi:uncharacterized membrane-anchored protein YjiN (DUF445 family)